MLPSSRVLDLFAVPDDVQPLPGGRGASVRAGDLVLSPGRDPEVLAWLNPVLARLAVRLDESRGHGTRHDVRIAMPVPARDGSWVVEGWGACRYEPGSQACDDLDLTLAAGRLLHARLAVAVPERPVGLDDRRYRWAAAERQAFGEEPLPAGGAGGPLVARLAAELTALEAARTTASGLGRPQLVHADLAGNLLLDADGAPVVIDVSPAWRPVRWAEAVAVLDAVTGLGADPSRVATYAEGGAREAMLRAALFRLLGDRPADLEAYRRSLAPLL